jgi:uncharacterized protein
MKTNSTFNRKLISAFGLSITIVVLGDDTSQKVGLVQDWSGTGLISKENDWSGVPGFVGYRGDKLIPKPGTNPQTVTADGTSTTVQVLANQRKPETLRAAGIAEFDGLTNPVVAFKGSANASAPFLLLHLDTRGKTNVAVGYKLRDIDPSANNAVQSIAFQYRLNTNAAFIDLPSGFIADATIGPSEATLVTRCVVLLPADSANQPLVQVRWLTTNAEGNDEWVGIDDIGVIGDDFAIATGSRKETSSTNRVAKTLRSPRDAENP